MKRILTVCNPVLIAIAISALPMFLLPVATHAGNWVAKVTGGGGAVLIIPDELTSPLRFGLAGTVRDGGSAEGQVNFVLPAPFAEVWGAVPGVDLIHIEGRVTSGFVTEDGSVILEGTLTERDYTKGEGVVFIEEDVPFSIEVGGSLGSNTIKLQWCLLPEFLIEVTEGNLRVN